jgi:hypothetical protein
MEGKILFIRPDIRQNRLVAKAVVRTEDCGFCEAWLGGRELDALLPRSLLAGSDNTAPGSLLPTLAAILQRLAVGRKVQVKRLCGARFVSFQSWREVEWSRSDTRTNSA